MPAGHQSIPERYGPARWCPRTWADSNRARRLDLAARIVVAYVAEDPFRPRPLAPLLERVRSALHASEMTQHADRGALVRRRGRAEGALPSDALEGERETADQYGREGRFDPEPDAACLTGQAIS